MTRSSRSLATQLTEMAIAVPQVMAHRLTRLARAGPTPSARDRREFDLMSAEKTAAFSESWAAMWMQACVAQQRLAFGWLRSSGWPFVFMQRLPSAATSRAQLTRAGLGVLGKGLAPVHRRAVANAKRLGGVSGAKRR